jgi:outer membrane immunogenic protein
MKKKLSLLAVAASMLVSSAAYTADMAPRYTKAPPPAPVPVYDWTGFYVGVELGGKWGNTTWTTTAITNPPFIPVVDGSSPRTYNPTSGRFGGYAGYNWQFGPSWVAGVEADFAWADKRVTAIGVPGCTINCTGFPGPQADLSSVRMRWDASARGRLGFLVAPSVLLYGTGGVAWQDIETSATCQHSSADPFCFVLPGKPFITATNSTTRIGWTIGAGIDAMLSPNWIARAEYRYANFGTRNDVLNLTLAGASSTIVYGLRAETHIATVGIAYKFGCPVVARY